MKITELQERLASLLANGQAQPGTEIVWDNDYEIHSAVLSCITNLDNGPAVYSFGRARASCDKASIIVKTPNSHDTFRGNR